MASHRCWCCKTIAVIICLLSRPLGWWVAGGSFSGPGVGQVFTVTLRVDLSFAARAVAAPVECGGARCLGVGWVAKWELKWYGGLWRGICSAKHRVTIGHQLRVLVLAAICGERYMDKGCETAYPAAGPVELEAGAWIDDMHNF
jgi:hypothetical protein